MEHQDPSIDYLSGFNQGYYLAKHAPELANNLTSINSTADRIIGIKEGIEEYSLEKARVRDPDWLKKDRLIQTKKSDKDKERE